MTERGKPINAWRAMDLLRLAVEERGPNFRLPAPRWIPQPGPGYYLRDIWVGSILGEPRSIPYCIVGLALNCGGIKMDRLRELDGVSRNLPVDPGQLPSHLPEVLPSGARVFRYADWLESEWGWRWGEVVDETWDVFFGRTSFFPGHYLTREAFQRLLQEDGRWMASWLYRYLVERSK